MAMRKSFLTVWPLLAAGLAGACAPRPYPADAATQMARRCATAVYEEGLRRGGINRFSSREVMEGELAAWGGFSSGEVPVLSTRSLPVTEASALDGPVIGSAWQGCMQQGLRALPR
jgi:hypothetical protein